MYIQAARYVFFWSQVLVMSGLTSPSFRSLEIQCYCFVPYLFWVTAIGTWDPFIFGRHTHFLALFCPNHELHALKSSLSREGGGGLALFSCPHAGNLTFFYPSVGVGVHEILQVTQDKKNLLNLCLNSTRILPEFCLNKIHWQNVIQLKVTALGQITSIYLGITGRYVWEWSLIIVTEWNFYLTTSVYCINLCMYLLWNNKMKIVTMVTRFPNHWWANSWPERKKKKNNALFCLIIFFLYKLIQCIVSSCHLLRSLQWRKPETIKFFTFL